MIRNQNLTAMVNSKKIMFVVLLITSIFTNKLFSQSGTEFWLAPPEVTDLHNPPGGEPLYLLISSMGSAATVTISQPANGLFTPIVVNVAANKSARVNLTAYKASLETQPTNTILNTGLKISSTATITAYYEVSNTNNTDIWALKGPNGLGYEFYIPLHKHAPFYNHNTFAAPHQALATFDIVATQNNTIVTIYSPVAVDGHAALTQFSITLNEGQTYSCGWSGANYDQPSTHPSGAVVLADKPIAVSIKDDSNHNPSGGCYDLMGDQIVPVTVIGNDYVAVKGSLNATGDESLFITATENNTAVYIDGSTTASTVLFAGETYRIDMDYLSASANNAVYVNTSKPVYATHVTGFGCESGVALLPPLNCAGSQKVNFVRSTSEGFFVTILARATTISNFTITGPGTATINPASFVTVPGTGGVWMAARIQYNTTQIPVDSTFSVTNSADVFALGIINGGATSGCRFGFFSEFVAPIVVDAGSPQTVCANDTAQLAGSIVGGASAGLWTSSGTGSFIPNATTLNAKYVPSVADIASTTVTLTLTSTSICSPQQDQMVLTFTPAPVVDAGAPQSICKNNANVTLAGSVTVASGGVWTGGGGSYNPGNTTLNAVYTPTAAELAVGSVTLTLTSTGNGICNPVSDIVTITFTTAPTVSAGSPQTLCGNNTNATLAGVVSVATGGVWSGGGGSFSPSVTALNAVYTPSASEISAGSVILTLTSTGNGTCSAVSNTVNLTFSLPPTAEAGNPQTLCANNATATMGGSVTIATGGVWSGGLGVFSPSNTALNAAYTPTTTELASGSVTLTLTTTGNGTCNAVNDLVTLIFTTAPIVDAGSAITVCANNQLAQLDGSYTIAGGILWSGGTGNFTSTSDTDAVYTPSAAEITAGTATLTLTTTNNGTCNPVNDQVVITIAPTPVVTPGSTIAACENNATVTLGGNVANAGGGIWSGGLGTFNPSNTTLNAIYTPTAAEISSGSVSLTLTSTGNGACNAVNGSMNITFSPKPTVFAGNPQTVCANNATVNLNGVVNVAAGGQWTGGLGTFNPSSTDLNADYTPTAAESLAGTVSLILTTTGNGTCVAEKDTIVVAITTAPTVDAGLPQMVCENNSTINLNGSFAIASGVNWSGGNGVYSPGSTSTTASYVPTASEIAAGQVELFLTTTGNGNCNAVTDSVIMSILSKPVVNAGNDVTVCITNLNVGLSGSISGPTNTGTWTSFGTGTFSPSNTALNATYMCSSADSLAGSVTLVLTSTNNQSCIAVKDTMIITILPAGTANAGTNETVCANNSTITLNGVVGGGATAGVWSTNGTGAFVPDVNTLNATYLPSTGDMNNGQVTLTLTANSCNNATSNKIITITPSPVVTAGSDITTCSNSLTVQLNGNVSGGSTTGIWTTSGSGSFTPGNTSLNATYTASAADSAAKDITLVLTSTNNGTCNAVKDTVILHIYPTGTAEAGPGQSICSNNPVVQLNGSLGGGATQGMWSTSGSGSFSNNTNLNANYVASAADITAGSVNLILTATNSCNLAVDFMTVIFSPAPSVNAGSDQSVCGSNPLVYLFGNVSGAGGGVWSGGNGSFTPSASILNATYVPTPAEINSGSVTLTLTSTSNGSCNAVADNLMVTFTSSIVANAGQNQLVCKSATGTSLQGIVSNGSTTGMWITLGSGAFTPNDSALNATYVFSAADTAAGSVFLVLSSTNNGTCAVAKDTMKISFGSTVFAYAGADIEVCTIQPIVNLNGFVSGGSSTGQWMSSGSGLFTPNNQSLSATYTLSSFDLSNGQIDIVLQSTNNGGCLAGSDTLTINVRNIPVANAGPSQNICGTSPLVSLTGNVSGGSSTGKWTTDGSGTFTPSDTSMNAVYNGSALDVLNGYITITLTSTGNGSCGAVSDTMKIVYLPEAIVGAGLDQTICANGTASLNGSVVGAGNTGMWTSLGTGSFSPNAQALNAVYTPSAGDINNGSVKLVLSTINNGVCGPKRDTLQITFDTAPSVNAGPDQDICGSSALTTLAGNVSGGTSTGIWSTLGSGTFTSNTVLNTIYTPSSADILNVTVQLILTSTNSGTCAADKDTVMITYSPAATISAGVDQTVCTNATIQLNGSVVGAGNAGSWTTLGSGTFNPDINTLNAMYIPSASDISNGSVKLILATVNNGTCGPRRDTVQITFNTPASVSAGGDQTLCNNESMASLNGIVTGGAGTVLWTSIGTGTFVDNTLAVTNYTLSSADKNNGSVTLIIQSTGNGVCAVSRDTVKITIGAKPTAAFSYNVSTTEVTFQDQSVNVNSWDWDFGSGGASSAQQNPVFDYQFSGTYYVTLIGYTTIGCSDTAKVQLTITTDQTTNVVDPVAVPSGFTPNGDGVNDELTVKGGPFTTLEFKIFNEWGNLIYESNNPNAGWDGTYKGVKQQPGVYIYIAIGETIDGKAFRLNGDVTLLK